MRSKEAHSNDYEKKLRGEKEKAGLGFGNS
jgi:hypothetical protein